MQTVSVVLIVVGLAIIAAVLVMRWRLHREHDDASLTPRASRTQDDVADYDPLFAVPKKAPPRRGDEMDGYEAEAPIVTTDPSSRFEPTSVVPPIVAAPRPPLSPRRSAPRTAADPERVIALNVMAADGERFGGVAIAAAAQRAGLELGTWSIYHYYSGEMPEAPPLFSVANMVKPGSFDLDQLHEISTVGLSLFMVPAGDEQDTQSLDIMLETARQLASELGGDVRDARRSVLTRQAIDRLREQLNEERFKARAARS